MSERIATKLRSEATLHHEIAESEKELKGLRISTDSAEFVLKHKDAAVSIASPLKRSSLLPNIIPGNLHGHTLDDCKTCFASTHIKILTHYPTNTCSPNIRDNFAQSITDSLKSRTIKRTTPCEST